MNYKLTAIVSGGQTGSDRGGLQAAIDLGLGWGGWAPAGWKAEDGEIPAVYRDRMRCTTSSDYGMRTRLNVQDSDGTLLVSFEQELTGGSAFTERTCERTRKPYLHLVLPDRGKTRVPDEVRAGVLEWISDCRISVLNVAGPRESKSPGLQEAVRDLLVWIFEPEAKDDAPPATAEEHAIVREIAAEVTQLIGTPPSTSPDPEVTAIMDTVRDFVDAAPKIGDVIYKLPDGTPVRWGGGEPMEVSHGDPHAFDVVTVTPTPTAPDDVPEYTFREGECVSIIQPEGEGPAICVDGWETLKKWNAAEDAERDFIAECERLAAELPRMDRQRRHHDEGLNEGLAETRALVERFYAFPNNGAGGSLHVVLDDGNTERENVEYCLKYAEQNGDAAGVALAKLLLVLTDEEREAL